MTTIILDSHTSGLSLENLLQRAADGELQIRDAEGKVVAYVLAAAQQQYLASMQEIFARHSTPEKLREALQRRDGITTAELLKRCELAAQHADKP